jgi:hypothetical protein
VNSEGKYNNLNLMNRGKNIIISDCEWIEDSDYILLGEYVFGFSLYRIIGNRI